MRESDSSFFEEWKVEREVRFEAVRSRGPGGQNVNKVSSSAVLYWNPYRSQALSHAQIHTIGLKLAERLNEDGEVYIRSDEFRDLERNKSRCLEKLFALLRATLHKPKPRKATRPTRASKERKLKAKAIRSEVKQGRKRITHD